MGITLSIFFGGNSCWGLLSAGIRLLITRNPVVAWVQIRVGLPARWSSLHLSFEVSAEPLWIALRSGWLSVHMGAGWPRCCRAIVADDELGIQVSDEWQIGGGVILGARRCQVVVVYTPIAWISPMAGKRGVNRNPAGQFGSRLPAWSFKAVGKGAYTIYLLERARSSLYIFS